MRKYRIAVVVAGLVLTLQGASSWGGNAKPTINDFSDANENTAGGTAALQSNTTGQFNTAFGDSALESNTTGHNNTAVGDNALESNTSGSSNTASGFKALQSNTSGSNNTAVGNIALISNTAGGDNTAIGVEALLDNTTGGENTASGTDALQHNTAGGDNTATGFEALQHNTAGGDNTASGTDALQHNTTGSDNTAVGDAALLSNTTGGENTASGVSALQNKTSGDGNIALGFNAGFHLTSGNKNIYLGNTGAASESNTMRLGQVLNQTRTFIAGIYNVPLSSGSPKAVYVNSSGQVGLLASSARYKRDIHDMGARSQGLFHLRPVTFRYKQDAQGQRQYGLIAEDVAKVYPELVTKGADGKVESVQYHELIPMLLNEVQRQQQQIAELTARLEQLETGKGQRATLTTR